MSKPSRSRTKLRNLPILFHGDSSLFHRKRNERNCKQLVDAIWLGDNLSIMAIDSISIDRQILEDTINDLCESEKLLIREAQAITTRIQAIQERVKTLQEKLSQANRSAGSGNRRLRKGEGIASILRVLNGPDGLGLSQAQISEKTGITGSTVFRILNNNSDKVVVGQDRLWRKKAA